MKVFIHVFIHQILIEGHMLFSKTSFCFLKQVRTQKITAFIYILPQ